ncbi:hypothetical protein ABPG72_003049 [Tetrahymena utriculariae]
MNFFFEAFHYSESIENQYENIPEETIEEQKDNYVSRQIRKINSSSSSNTKSQKNKAISKSKPLANSQSKTKSYSNPKHIYERLYRVILNELAKKIDDLQNVGDGKQVDDETIRELTKLFKDASTLLTSCRWKANLFSLFKEIHQKNKILRIFNEISQSYETDEFESYLSNYITFLPKRQKSNNSEQDIQYQKDNKYNRVVETIRQMIKTIISP